MTLLNDSALDTLSKRIRAARLLAEMRQSDLAEICGVSRSAVNEWEQARSEPSASKMFAIARATNQPLDWFAEGLDSDVVRPKGLEPLTFWLVADQAERARYEDRFWSIVCQEFPDSESAYLAAVA